MTDIVERLCDLRRQPQGPTYKALHQLCAEAADEIERLRQGRETMGNLWAREKEARHAAESEIERLKEALYRAKWEGGS